jgi:hypothetical protein
MPQWFKKLFSRKVAEREPAEPQSHEWAEFNLPANADLQILYGAHAGAHADGSYAADR